MKTLLPLSFALLFSFTVSAQEICGNHIDDNANGLIDCYDASCASQNSCPGFFYGYPPIACQRMPPVGPFGVLQTWESTVSSSTRSIVLVADVDNDGVPEVIAHNKNANELYILNGVTGAVELAITCPAIGDFSNAIAVADVDGDGFGEIIAVDNSAVLHCFEHTGTPKVGFVNPSLPTGECSPGIADFDGNGIPEIYVDNRIYNSLTGALIVSGGAGSSGLNPAAINSQPIAADVLPDSYCPTCDGLELVCGNKVYAVDIAGATLIAQPNSLPASVKDGFTAVADMNMDGQLDVVVTFSGKIYIWDPRTGMQIGNTFAIPNTATGGRPNIADYDNDGKPEIGVGGLNRYAAVDFDIPTSTLSLLWINNTVDASQMTTGTAFDFEGDGITEVIYRDENRLYVYDGATGAIKLNIACGSGTRTEFPTVADVDGDGQADIICNCSTANQGSTGKVRVYRSDNNRWISTRKVMNQHAYHVTNINDDLSVPQHEQNNSTVSQINNFLCQAPLYDINWNPLFIPIPDLTIAIDSVIYCQAPDSIWITATVCNTGSAAADSSFPLSFYSGNPLSGGSLIKNQSYTTLPVDTAACTTQTFSVPWSNSPFTLYVAVNDKGTNAATAPELSEYECDSTNNIASRSIVNPVVYPIITGLDSQYCLVNQVIPLTGAPAGGVFSGTGISGNNFNPSVAGAAQHIITYTYTTGVCVYDTTQTVNVYAFPVPDAGADVSFCSGQNATLGNTAVNGYSYSWLPVAGLSNSTVSNPAVTLTNLTSSTIINEYILTVSENGCDASDTVEVSVFAIPVPDAGANVSFCSGQNATLGNNPIAGYAYAWLPVTGLSDPLASNPVVTLTNSAPAPSINEYVITASENGCTASDTVQVTVFSYPLADAGADVSFCSAQAASVGSNAVASYSYNWQPVTGLSNDTSANPSVTLTNPSSNPVTSEYIVLVIENGCSTSDTVEVTVNPFATVSAGPDISICLIDSPVTLTGFTPANGAWSGNGITDAVAGLFNPAVSGAGAHPLVYFYADIAYGCSSGDTMLFTVFDLPLADAGLDVSICSGSLTSLFATGGLTYQWWPSTGLDDPSVNNPIAQPANSITYFVQVSDANGCASVDSLIVFLKPVPVAGFSAENVCEGETTTFTDFAQPQGSVTYFWNMGDGATNNATLQTYNYSAPGTYNITQIVTENGCSDTTSQTVEVYPKPSVNFSAFPLSAINDNSSPITFTNTSTGASQYQWSFGDGAFASVISGAHFYQDTGWYSVLLTGISTDGCADSLEKENYIHILPKPLVFVPNVFTPNGDGNNDVLYLYGSAFHKIDFSIYNRWGELVFETDNAATGWDGKYKGKEAPMGIYTYDLSLVFETTEARRMKGTITLIR